MFCFTSPCLFAMQLSPWLGFCALVPTHALSVLTRISPELDPESHKEFFDKDYPHDQTPMVSERFTFKHPYPLVQDSSSFEADFVKDENADGGEWKAQMVYDNIRHRLNKLYNEAGVLKKTAQEAGETAAQAKSTAEAAEDDAHEKEAEVAKAESAHDAVQKEVDTLKANRSQEESDLSKEEKSFEDCRKELEVAKEKLKELVKEKESLEGTIADANDSTSVSSARAVNASVARDSVHKRIEVQQKILAEAERSYNEAKAREEDLQSKMSEAAENLRRVRSPTDGHHHKKKDIESSANQATVFMSLLLVVGSIL